MTKSPRTKQREGNLGLTQWLLLGTLAAAGAILAAIIQTTMVGNLSLAEAISRAPVAHHPGFGAMLWIGELLAYAVIAFAISHHLLVAVSAVVLGLLMRFFMSALIAMLLVASSQGGSFSAMLLRMDTELWSFRLLAILIALLSLILPFRRLLKSGYGLLPVEEETVKRQSSSAPRSFAFEERKSRDQLPPKLVTRAAAAATGIKPPDGFLPVAAARGVTGMITISARLVIASIMEAENVLPRDRQIRIRLAYIVPQLANGTVWLTWGQIFPGGSDDPNPLPKAEMAAELQDRWVRIAPKDYVKQVPPEFFSTEKTPPAWLTLPKVPQEDEFADLNTAAGGRHGIG